MGNNLIIIDNRRKSGKGCLMRPIFLCYQCNAGKFFLTCSFLSKELLFIFSCLVIEHYEFLFFEQQLLFFMVKVCISTNFCLYSGSNSPNSFYLSAEMLHRVHPFLLLFSMLDGL